MRTTVDIPEHLIDYARQSAAMMKMRMSDIVTQGLVLHQQKNEAQANKEKPFKLIPYDGCGHGDWILDPVKDKHKIQELLDREDYPEFFEDES